MKKILAKTVSWFLCAALLVCVFDAGTITQAAKVKLNKSKQTMEVGQKVKLKVKNYKKKVKWSSSKKKVAQVSKKGVVKAKTPGKTVITAKAGNKKMKCKITVINAKEQENIQQGETPVIQPTSVANVQQTAVPETNSPDNTVSPSKEPEATAEPTGEPEPSATPAYMQEGAFVYDKLDISWIDPEKPMVAFTFDDGPVGTQDTSYSMIIQNALKKYNFHATFNYITGRINSDSMKDEILMAMEAGHEIANHTSAYASLSDTGKYPDGQAVADEIENARKALSDITEISDFTLRPPNLAVNVTVQDNCNVPLIGCSIDSQDWNNATREQIINNVERAKDGDIILMHETQQYTADAIEELVQYFVDNGYQIVSVVELFAAKDIPLFAGNYYNKAVYQEPRN